MEFMIAQSSEMPFYIVKFKMLVHLFSHKILRLTPNKQRDKKESMKKEWESTDSESGTAED